MIPTLENSKIFVSSKNPDFNRAVHFSGHQHQGGANRGQAVERAHQLDPPETPEHPDQPELHRVRRQRHN